MESWIKKYEEGIQKNEASLSDPTLSSFRKRKIRQAIKSEKEMLATLKLENPTAGTAKEPSIDHLFADGEAKAAAKAETPKVDAYLDEEHYLSMNGGSRYASDPSTHMAG